MSFGYISPGFVESFYTSHSPYRCRVRIRYLLDRKRMQEHKKKKSKYIVYVQSIIETTGRHDFNYQQMYSERFTKLHLARDIYWFFGFWFQYFSLLTMYVKRQL